jgi:hypothetical protein
MGKKTSKQIVVFKSPDLSKLQEVVIDFITKIYVPIGADTEKAKQHFLSRRNAMNKSLFPTKKRG